MTTHVAGAIILHDVTLLTTSVAILTLLANDPIKSMYNTALNSIRDIQVAE